MLVLEGAEDGFDSMKFLLEVYIVLFPINLFDASPRLLTMFLLDT
jgi:hypothetical protein